MLVDSDGGSWTARTRQEDSSDACMGDSIGEARGSRCVGVGRAGECKTSFWVICNCKRIKVMLRGAPVLCNSFCIVTRVRLWHKAFILLVFTDGMILVQFMPILGQF
jgi:hypothetical protein